MIPTRLPVDPRCVAMDALRSCYTTLMRFPGVGVVPIVWYFTDRPPLDVTHVYGSHNHSREDGWDDWDTGEAGEVWGAPRTYYNGALPVGLTCGQPFGTIGSWAGGSDERTRMTWAHTPGGANASSSSFAAVSAVSRRSVRAFPELAGSNEVVGLPDAPWDSSMVGNAEVIGDAEYEDVSGLEGAGDVVNDG